MAAGGFRYARSADGTSIAYMRMGTGPALVIVPPVPFSNVAAELAVRLVHGAYESLARRFELLLYDGRGTGASQRAVTDLSTAALTADLEAVMDHAGVDRAALLALYLAAGPAVSLAAQRPERASHLVLFGAVPNGATALQRPGTAALLSLIDEDWDLFTQTAALDWMGWGAGDMGEEVARAFRSTTDPRVAKAALKAYAATDLGPLLGSVQAPTLVLHRRHGRQLSMDQSSDLASRVPGGRLQVLDGASATLFFDDPEGTVDAIAAFVRPGFQPPVSRSVAATRPELTAREAEVLRLIAGGDTNQGIAASLGLSVHTVERHAANIYRKIDARGRADATAWALRNGLG